MTKEELREYKKKNHVIEREPEMDKLKFIEMQINKKEILLEKAKVVVVKLDKIFLVFPFTISKIELRMRNTLFNNRKIMDGISHFMNFYLLN